MQQWYIPCAIHDKIILKISLINELWIYIWNAIPIYIFSKLEMQFLLQPFSLVTIRYYIVDII